MVVGWAVVLVVAVPARFSNMGKGFDFDLPFNTLQNCKLCLYLTLVGNNYEVCPYSSGLALCKVEHYCLLLG